MARVLSVGYVQLSLQKSNPPTILVDAGGSVGTPGWKKLDLVPMEKVVSSDGILDLEFVGTPPSDPVIQRVTQVTADFVIDKDVDKIVGVVVHSRTNSITQLLSSDGSGWPGGGSLAAATMARFDAGNLTTLAVGEEGTHPAGESHPLPIEKFAHHNAETMALIPSESVPYHPGEKLPWIDEKLPYETQTTNPYADTAIQRTSFPGENGPGPDPWQNGPGPDPWRQLMRSPFGTR